MKRATAFSPASIGNVAVGFDILGHSVAGAGDRVTVTLTDSGTVKVVAIRGAEIPLPLTAIENTAGRALLTMLKSLPAGLGFEVEIDKGIAMGSGMGGSAASAVAAVVAANAVLDAPVSREILYQCAMDGEAAATGSAHGDNVGPMLLGGLVIAPAEGAPVKVPTPEWLHVALVHPHFVLETRKARAALAGSYELHDFVVQSEGLALLLSGCFLNDASLIQRGFRDVLVEPRRASLIPGFAKVKQAALDSGALGASISGAGPSVFGWFTSREGAERAGKAMAAAFKEAGLESDQLVSPVSGPAAGVIP
ncbi:MAG: homoserine kinase [Archangium sp.]|nr:homoserine kinase [Archangium sp.]MDP3574646.1 homoserine kinase [Archangium sp.]